MVNKWIEELEKHKSGTMNNFNYNGNEFNYWNFEDQNIYWGINSQDLDYYLDTDLNDSNNNFSSIDEDSGPAMYYSTDSGEITGEHEFMIKYKHSSGGSSTINLGFMIVEGSEVVRLNGKLVTLAKVVSSADWAPTKQSYEVLELVSKQIDSNINSLKDIQNKEISSFEELIKRSELPPIYTGDFQ